MRHLVIPLLLIAICLDVYCMVFWETISSELYYIGEPIVYMLWVSAFWIYAKWTPTKLQRKIIIAILLMWLPYCVNTAYRQISGIGHEKSVIDIYSGIISALLVIGQSLIWWFKNRKDDSH